MRRTEKLEKLREIFDVVYADAKCSLDYTTPHELLVAVQLSAQCTDARVNIVTKDLFERYKSPWEFAEADIDELQSIIKPCGFYRTKAENIKKSSADIAYKYNGRVPDTMEELTALAGVGRKTANLILGDVYGKPALVIDTHAIRLTNRLGLTRQKDPVKIEFDLKKFVPDDYQIHLCHQLVFHGRAICNARSPKCDICPVSHLCKEYGKAKK